MPTRSECNCNGYKNAHAVVRRALLKLYPEKCMFCGSTDNVEAANVSDNPFSRDKRDYILLCKKHHVRMDGHDHNLSQGIGAVEKTRRDRAAGLKTCPRCKEIQPLHNFRVDMSRAYGHFPYCLVCEKAINKEKSESRSAARKLKGMKS